MNLKKWKGIFTSKFVGTGPSSYEKRIYRAAVSQRLRNTILDYTKKCLFLENKMSLTVLKVCFRLKSKS